MTFRPEQFEDVSRHIPEAVMDWVALGKPEPAPREAAAWLSEAPENRVLLEDVSALWELTRTPAPPPDLWAGVENRIERQTIPFKRLAPRRKPGWVLPLRAAALVVLGLGIGLLWPRLRATDQAPVPAVAVQVPAGATSTVELPGGITVRMNAASRLTYRPEAGSVQEVRLEGEAYFTVAHDPDRLFSVKTAAGVVRDLGTEFNVRARGNRVAVAVAEGAVTLAAAGKEVKVTAGQVAHATAEAPPSAPEAASLAGELAWMDGRLAFYDQTLSEIAPELERHYGIRLRVAPALQRERVTALVSARAEAGDAVRIICQTVGAHCTRGAAGEWVIRK